MQQNERGYDDADWILSSHQAPEEICGNQTYIRWNMFALKLWPQANQ